MKSSVLDNNLRQHVEMSLEDAVRHDNKYWGELIDNSFSVENFMKNEGSIRSAMTKCGYEPLKVDKNGKHVQHQGMYTFTHRSKVAGKYQH